MNQLTVYRASAGSGKTFRLAVEYIKCLIERPKAYENILAVTFTNKATEEMKMRILSTLYGLSHHLQSTQDYMDKILEELKEDVSEGSKGFQNISEDFVSKRAGEALHELLHNYSYFKVQTIDRFFQSVLRNLARELDLTPNLRVELGSKEIEYQAVDEVIDSLRSDSDVMKWIMDFIHSNMDSGHQWNIIESIKKFGEQLLKDDYKQIASDTVSGPTVVYETFKKSLYARKKSCSETMNAIGKEIIAAIPGGDPLIFKSKSSGVGGYIQKMATLDISEMREPSKTVQDASIDATGDCWVGKKDGDALRNLALETIKPMLQDALMRISRLQLINKSCDLTLAHISELRLLQEIEKRIKQDNAETGRFLLSDTQTLLGGMIHHSDSPFIYEKIGSRLSRIMIDEFQDTSVVQWKNFKVLLDDCMSHGTGSLIVGDVKQSIYRWRSGDWRLLNNIQDEFRQTIGMETLADNYRSCPDIIRFNNTFFRIASGKVYDEEKLHLPEEESDMLRNAYRYSTLCQQIPEKDRSHDSSDGHVDVLSICEDDDEIYDRKTCEACVNIIGDLLSRGVSQNKIAILVRSNYRIGPLAAYIMDNIPEVHVVSDEAFRLDASKAVRMIIDAMRVITNPEDVISRAQLAASYQKNIVCNENDDVVTDIVLSGNPEAFLPEAFITDFETLTTLPLYQLAERLYVIFSLKKLSSEAAFVSTFFDSMRDFISHQIATVQSWLKWWDEKVMSETIESDSDNGLRILSIHKSKGLAFEHVICPFADWIMNKSSILWAKPDMEPFNELNMIPLDYTDKLCGSIYEHDYRYEHLQNAVDDLNLLYVAFTRTKRNLFIITRNLSGKSEKVCQNNRSTLINDTLEAMLTEEPGTADGIAYEPLSVTKTTTDDGLTLYTYGGDICVDNVNDDVNKKASISVNVEKNVFETRPERVTIDCVDTFCRKQEFRQSNESKAFTTTDEEEEQRNDYIKLGSLLHYAFQNIRTVDDVSRAIFDIECQGLLFGQDVTAGYLREKINHCLRNPEISRWFSPDWDIYNECTILEPQDNSTLHQHRPDRVIMRGGEVIVIDFKLQNHNPHYHEQVRRYMDLLKGMGHQNVRGYLLYMLPAIVEEVK